MWPRYRIFYIHGSNWIFCGLNTPWISDLPNHSKSSWKDSCCLLNSYELVPCKTHALLDYCFESRHLSVGKSYWSAALGHTVHAWVDTQSAIWCLNGYMRNIPVTLAHYHWFYDWTAQWSWVLMDAKRESKSTLASWLDIPQVKQEWWICHCQICLPQSNTRFPEWDGRHKGVSPRKPQQTSWNSTFESLISKGTKSHKEVSNLSTPLHGQKHLPNPDSLSLALFL